MTKRRKGTASSSFGVGRRESHDSSYFYSRFAAPKLSSEAVLNRPGIVDEIYCGDARHMDKVRPESVALVVTSPPYFVGKEYEEALGAGHVPATYFDFLEMLHEVFSECVDKLEPGGRIAVNVANLGRKPYRSLSADVIGILQDRLGLLMRGEIIWRKARGAGGSCAWGSFQSAANPVLRDLTERVVVASKGRFDRAVSRAERARLDLPSNDSIFKDEFLEATTDVWDIPSESATRVGHPAPFPVELLLRLIDLYTYREDLVLDPFMGAGTAAVAAVRSGRHFIGYDTDEGYVLAAKRRVQQERDRATSPRGGYRTRRAELPSFPKEVLKENHQARSIREGETAKEIARAVLRDCGFEVHNDSRGLHNGVEVDFAAEDQHGGLWYFDVSGGFTGTRSGLSRTDTLWKTLGRAGVLAASETDGPLILLTTNLPPRGSAGDVALRAARGVMYFDAIEMLSAGGQERLREYAATGIPVQPAGELLPPEDADHPAV